MAYSLLQSIFQMVMENIENTPVKDKKKKKKEKEKDLGEMQVKLLLQWSLKSSLSVDLLQGDWHKHL